MIKKFTILLIILLIAVVSFGVTKGLAQEERVSKAEIKVKKIIRPAVLERAQQFPNEFQRVIIIFDKKPVGYRNFIDSLGGGVTHDYNIIEGIAVSLPGRAIERLTKLKNIISIQEDRIVQAFLDDSIPLINADDVWALGYDGSGKTVCVIDTGVDDSHPALNPLVAEKCYCSGNPGPNGCCPGKTEVGNDATDDNGHGTHVAGTIASRDSTYRGVAPGVSLMAVKVLDSSGSGWESDIILGIQWCSDQNADVISISLGGGLFSSYCDSEADAQAVNNAVDAGSVVSIASGNNGSTSQISAPACASKAISVGATTKSDQVASYTNRNSILDLLAPGGTLGGSHSCPTNDAICSTQLGGGFIGYSGTSMATPMVAGAAALLLEANPSLTPAEVEFTLENTGVDIYDSGSGLTFPRIDILAAVGLPELGHLEPYLIDPTSDKNVIQNEFFTFRSGVKCVGGECGDVSATLDPEIELAYDDGTPDIFSGSAKYLGWGNPGGGMAVRFTSPSYPIKIKTARFYVSDTTPFELHIWSDNNMPDSDLIIPFQVNPDISESWYDIDLSSYNIEITSGDFYIGWIELSATNYVGTDTTPPHDDRSWIYNGSSWALLSSYGTPYDNIDMMIRAVVETGKGAIPMNSGNPFYTTSDNPQTCLNMQDQDTCEQTWQVNATGELDSIWEFFTIYDPITYEGYIETSKTGTVNITIKGVAVSITLTTDGSVEFGIMELGATEDTTASGLNDVETVQVVTGPADLNVRSSVFSDNGNSWSLGSSNGVNQVQWEFASSTPGSWSTFLAADTLYSLADSVAEGATQNFYLKLTMPTASDSASQYGSTVTIVATEP